MWHTVKHNSTLFILYIFLLVLTSCNGGPELKIVTPLEAYGMVRNDFGVLVDLRLDSKLIAQGALLLPASKIVAQDSSVVKIINKISKQKTVLLYGDKLSIDTPVVVKLHDLGFQLAYLGTFTDWEKAKLPTALRR